jgi:HK97 family phage major capsid protein
VPSGIGVFALTNYAGHLAESIAIDPPDAPPETRRAATHPQQPKESRPIVDQILEALRASISEKLTQRDAATSVQQALIETAKKEERKFTDLETREFGMKTEAKTAIDAELDELRSRQETRAAELLRDKNADELRSQIGAPATGGAKVGKEERTYSEGNGSSFFQDVYKLQTTGDFVARERLERNYREAIVEKEFIQRDGSSKEARAIGTSAVASLVIPQYLTGLNAPVLRKGRPFANLANQMQIPEQGMSFIIPRGTTGASAAAQATQNSAISNTDEVWADLTVTVATIAGKQNVSRQILERGAPGVDQIVYGDLVRAYAAELDRQAIYGLGSSGEMLGALKTAGIYAATQFGAVPSAANFFLKLAGQIGAIADAGAGFEANAIVMSPRRWAWLTALVDTTGRPLVTPVAGSYNSYGLNLKPGAYSGEAEGPGYKVVGQLQGLPVITAGNTPKVVGTNNEDLVAVVDTSNLLLWEDGDGMPKELRFDQTQGDSLTTILGVYGYAAFAAGRYPTAVGSIGGLDTVATYGLVAPTF